MPSKEQIRSIIAQCAKKAHVFAQGRTVKSGEFVIVKRSCLLELVYELRELSKEIRKDLK